MYCHSYIYSSVPLFIVTHNPAFTFVMYTRFHCSHLHLLCVYCHSLYNGVLLCIVHQVSQPVAIAATLSIRDFLPHHTLSCHFFVRFLIFLFSSYYSFPHITSYNNSLATVPYILRRMKIQHISVQGRKVFFPCQTLSCHFLCVPSYSSSPRITSHKTVRSVAYQEERKPIIYRSKVVFHPRYMLSFLFSVRFLIFLPSRDLLSQSLHEH